MLTLTAHTALGEDRVVLPDQAGQSHHKTIPAAVLAAARFKRRNRETSGFTLRWANGDRCGFIRVESRDHMRFVAHEERFLSRGAPMFSVR